MPICVVDQVEFDSKRSDARFCSPACRKYWNRKVVDGANEEIEKAVKEVKQRVSLKTKKAEYDALNPSTGEIIPDEVIEEHKQATAQLNAILESKGLPTAINGFQGDFFVSTGIPELDELTKAHDIEGVGGLPRKRLTEIFGPKSSGKTSIIKSIVKDPSLKILYLDAEGGLTSPPEHVSRVEVSLVEEVTEIVVAALDANIYDVILLDSIAALVTAAQYDNEKEQMAAKSKEISKLVNNTIAHLRPKVDGKPSTNKGAAVVFINQLRDNVGTMYGAKEYTPGGRAPEFLASYRLEFRSNQGDKIKRSVDGVQKIVGQVVKVTVKKTRYGEPDKVVKFKLMYDLLQDYDDYYQKRVKELLG